MHLELVLLDIAASGIDWQYFGITLLDRDMILAWREGQRNLDSWPNMEFPKCQHAAWISQLGYHVLIRWNCEILCRSDIVAATIVWQLDFGLWERKRINFG